MKVLIILSVVLNIIFLLFFIFDEKRRKFDKFVEKEKDKELRMISAEEVTNRGLLEVCKRHLNGKWCEWWEEDLSLDTILKIVLQCKEYLFPFRQGLYKSGYLLNKRMMSTCVLSLNRTLTGRQIDCAFHVSHLLGKKEYIHALHEFMDCIDDNGNTRKEPRIVSINEYALYSCLLEMFLSNLEGREHSTT